MTALLHINPENPQKRLINQVVDKLHQGGVIIYPTDCIYSLGCKIGNKAALERIRHIRHLDKNYQFTLVCHSLSQLSHYAYIDNPIFRILKNYTPGPYTFILPASKEIPRRLFTTKRKTIGLRIPNNKIALEILAALNEPLMSISMLFADENLFSVDPEDLYEAMRGKVDIVINGGLGGLEPSTVIDLTGEAPKVIRVRRGNPEPFEA